MIDELNLVKEIVSGLSTAGIWGFLAYLLSGLTKTLTIWGSLLYIANKALVLGFQHFKAPLSKEEQRELQKKHDELLSNSVAIIAAGDADKVKLRSEVQEVQHLYKLLKESAEQKEQVLQDQISRLTNV